MDKIKPTILDCLHDVYSTVVVVRDGIQTEHDRAKETNELEHLVFTVEDATVMIAMLEDAEAVLIGIGRAIRKAEADQSPRIIMPKIYN